MADRVEVPEILHAPPARTRVEVERKLVLAHVVPERERVESPQHVAHLPRGERRLKHRMLLGNGGPRDREVDSMPSERSLEIRCGEVVARRGAGDDRVVSVVPRDAGNLVPRRFIMFGTPGERRNTWSGSAV